MKWTRLVLSLCLLTSTSALALAAYSVFRDVPEGAWYAPAVDRLANLNILQGNPDGTYRPSKVVTRAELAVALDRLLEYVQTGTVRVENAIKTLELAVPFTSQVPTGKWILPYKEACEEASLIMVDYFLEGKKLTAKAADQEILALVQWEEAHGYGVDVSAEQIATIAREFYELEAEVFYDDTVTTATIKAKLDAGSPVIIPAAGRTLANPNYTGDGPPYHMIVIIGYDENGFITHDPGVTAGASYEYSFATIAAAIHDWNGAKNTVETGRKAMVVLRKK